MRIPWLWLWLIILEGVTEPEADEDDTAKGGLLLVVGLLFPVKHTYMAVEFELRAC
jgi:hypothetical protein